MDSLVAGGSLEESVPPSYNTVFSDEEVSEAQPATLNEEAQPEAALLDRIGSAKVYLLSDSAQMRTAKRKHLDIEEDEDVDMDEDSVLRTNALFLTGAPISHLPTARIFAYVTHFDAQPIGLEWVNDSSCVLVFESKALARAAHRFLRKTPAEDMDENGFVMARAIPVTLWLPEDRITKSLGQGEGLRGTIRMRWAKHDDLKKKGARKESEFYRKYGSDAGKDDEVPQKRRRDEHSLLESQLDDDLDAFLGRERQTSHSHSPPPSVMHTWDGSSESRSLVERTSSPDSGTNLKRRTSSAPRDALTSRLSDRRRHDGDGQSDLRRRGRGRRNPRPQKTQKELDDELDAFLNEKS